MYKILHMPTATCCCIEDTLELANKRCEWYAKTFKEYKIHCDGIIFYSRNATNPTGNVRLFHFEIVEVDDV